MPQIAESNGLVTQITTVSVPSDKQDEALRVMKERARFMAKQPGFVNYVQWESREQLEAAHHSPEFRDKWPEFGKLVEDAEPALYDVVMVEEK